MIELSRTPLLLERTQPSVGLMPKSRTRRISINHQLGPTRRDLNGRLERRTRDRMTPQSREVARSLSKIRRFRSRNDIVPLHGKRRISPFMAMMGRKSVRSSLTQGIRM